MDTSLYSQLFTRSEIEMRIDQLASQIVGDYSTKSPLFIALMRGANPFASKLMFALARHNANFQPELDYMLVSTYGQDHTAKQPVIITDLAPTTVIQNRDVVMIDDVIDLGIT